ncbi:MAG: methylenetetrahydrofolate reductase C-terminal domain-containing protein [Nitrospirae bacterium]|nr:methylenetetrahydrofolate reductase C-terminal domain-containing protein [Nitrospirota bacterium]
MIVIFKQKPLEEILGYLASDKSVFLLRCSGCSKVNQVDAESDLKVLKENIKDKGISITGSAIKGLLCIKAMSVLEELTESIGNPSSILVMACGLGVQSIAEATDKVVHPACNSFIDKESLGRGKREDRCLTCGDCVLEFTGGICPLTVCSKGLLNGPCGGSSGNKCEISKEIDCGWIIIYERMKKLGRLKVLMSFLSPKDFRIYKKRR